MLHALNVVQNPIAQPDKWDASRFTAVFPQKMY